MPLTSLWQFLLPDSLLLEIFTYLDVRDLGRVAQVCTMWRRVSYDEFLWHQIARTRWKIKGPIFPGRKSWRSEVKRLVHHVPCVESEIFTDAHSDEVLDVSISHNGEYFCTTSKDSCIILWKFGFPSTQVRKVNTKDLFGWSLTQYSKFSRNDKLLLVCGVSIPDNLHEYPDVSLGRGAVFTVPDLQPVQHVNLDPPTLFGAWLTSDIYVGGDLHDLNGAIKIKAFKVPSYTSVENYIINSFPPIDLFYFRGNKHHQMSILVADVPVAGMNMRVEHRMHQCNSEVSTSTSLSDMSENQSEYSYNLSSDFSTDDLKTDKQHSSSYRGSGDFESANDVALKRKRIDMKENTAVSASSIIESKSNSNPVNQTIKELENSASFWDGMDLVKSYDQWRENPEAVSSSSECSADTPREDSCYSNFKNSVMPEGSSGQAEFPNDNDSETGDIFKCKKTRIDPKDIAGNVISQESESAESHVILCDRLKLSNSNTTVLSQDMATTDRGSEGEDNIPGVASFNSDVTCVLQAGDLCHNNSSKLHKGDSNTKKKGCISQNKDTSPVSLTHSKENRSMSQNTDTGSEMSFDKYYNADLHTNISSSTLMEDESDEEKCRIVSKDYFSGPVQSVSNRFCNFRKYICFVSGAHDSIAVKEVTVDKLKSIEEDFRRSNSQASGTQSRDGRPFDTKDNYFFIKNCYITGMCLSHDHRFIYFNYREWDRKEGESDDESEADNPFRDVSDRSFGENIKVGVIDLQTMTRLEAVTYDGHIGYSSYPAWYICLAASQDYLGSGSEDATAYLWDRHYRVSIAKLHHTLLVVNGLAFSPVDQETCVSVCDDKSIIVWRSRNRMNKPREKRPPIYLEL